MNICSMVVHARPEHVTHVGRQLEELAGVEVHAGTDEGKLIVTVEQADDAQLKNTLVAINQLSGVLSAVMVYHHEEAEESMDEEIFSETDKA
jgi:nitrate reductase NapD